MRVLFLLFFLSTSAFAYQSSLSSSGTGVTWSNRNIPVVIHPGNADLPSATASTIIQESMNEWNAQTPTKLVPSSTGLSEVSFKSDFSIYGPGVIGVTELTFTSGGAIQQGKVFLNDQNFKFRASPGLYASGEVFLGDVVTHELGHLLGLSHSEVLEASMFYAAFPGQSTLAADDRSGVRSKYASGNGTISGVVKGGGGVGVLGVHVVAFSRSTGEGVAAISDESGNFSIGGLSLGDSYYLYTSPLKNLSALPAKFSNVKNDFCPASYVGGFFDACGRENEGMPQAIQLTSAQPGVSVGTVTINCSLKSNEDYSFEKLGTSFEPLTILDYGNEDRLEKAFVGYFLSKNSTAWSAYDQLVVDLRAYADTSASRFLRIHLVGRQFGNLLEYQMEVSRNGALVGSFSLNYSTVTQTYDTDLSAFLPLHSDPAQNVFEIAIRARKLGTVTALQTFAELEQFVSNKNLPYLLMVGVEGTSGPILNTQSYLSDNEACLDAPFSYAVQPARSVASEIDSKTGPEGGAPLSCGTTGGSSGGPGGPGAFLMLMGFGLVLVLSSLRHSAKNFLS